MPKCVSSSVWIPEVVITIVEKKNMICKFNYRGSTRKKKLCFPEKLGVVKGARVNDETSYSKSKATV